MDLLLQDINKSINQSCCKGTCYHDHHINIQQIVKAISHLKNGKSDGSGKHTSEHIKHGTPRLNTLLSLLFTSMLHHGFKPHSLFTSTIISIPKNCK